MIYPCFRHNLKGLHRLDTIGKDEVTSSNLVSSSKISLKLVGFGEIFLVLVTLRAG